MIIEEDQKIHAKISESKKVEKDLPFHIFKKKPYLSIKDLQGKSKHLLHNKISDKLSRRDVQYYDLYALQDPKEEYIKIRSEGGFPYTQADAKIKELYGDLAWCDFNQVFKNHGDIVTQQYGKTLSVTLNVKKTVPADDSNARPSIKISRVIKEDMTRKNTDLQLFSK